MKQENKYAFSLFVIGTLFFVFGFITWINGILMPFLKASCELTTFQASFVPFAFYISYFFMAIPSSFLIKKVGYSGGMMLGLLTMAIGAILFVPAASTRQFPLFLTGLFIQGGGLTLLQAASNPYATILGPIETAARRISIMGVCNKLAGVIGFYTLYKALFSGMQQELQMIENGMLTGEAKDLALQNLSEQVILPYVIITAVFILLVLFIKLAKLPQIEQQTAEQGGEHRSIFSYPYMWLGVFAIFFYVGAEVIAIDYLIPYGKSLHLADSATKNFPIYAMFALIVGYFVGLLTVPKMISQRHALIAHLCIAIGLASVAICSKTLVHFFNPSLAPDELFSMSARLSISCIIMLSFAHAIMWPAIWPLSIHDLGKHTEVASGLLVMACAGGGVMSLIYGKLCELPHIGHQSAYSLLFVCYFYILFFATFGYKFQGKK
ncbi:MAG: sugar MFS transporter [Bacteroidales bacterium]|nr:sugar MFS transporter [Bacteroidales bacterium]